MPACEELNVELLERRLRDDQATVIILVRVTGGAIHDILADLGVIAFAIIPQELFDYKWHPAFGALDKQIVVALLDRGFSRYDKQVTSSVSYNVRFHFLGLTGSGPPVIVCDFHNAFLYAQ